MKKTLFSLAFVAASGVYVAAANHLLPLPASDDPATAKQVAAPADLSPMTSAASAAPLATSSIPPSSAPTPTVAEIAPIALPPRQLAQPADPMPPTPRPRPTPPAAIQPAASTAVAAGNGGGYRDGTYTGSSENAYYGRVQVQVTVANHQVAGVKVLTYPSDRRTSRYINSQALPLLQQEVIAANGASVDTVSGATLTSEAYIRSLGTALQQAGAAGA